MALGLLKVSKKTELKIREIAKRNNCPSSTVINNELMKWNNNQESILEYDNINNENVSLYFKTNMKMKNIANCFSVKSNTK